MPLTSAIQPHDPHWRSRYDEAAVVLAPVFGAALVGLHHVGSTAVPDLAAKPEIDVLALVRNTEALAVWTIDLAVLGYRRGGDLSPGHSFFKRDVAGLRTHKLHICNDGHPAAARMLRFRDHLRADPDERARYQALKLGLELENTDGIDQYLAGKAPYIDAVLARLG